MRKKQSPLQFNRDLPPFTVCAAVVADSGKIVSGCTGKVLKRTLRDSFWGTYRDHASGDRRTFLNVAWNT